MYCTAHTSSGAPCKNLAKFNGFCGVHGPKKDSKTQKKGPAITITFGDCAENHVGMQKLGQAVTSGFSYGDMAQAKQFFENLSAKCELYNLGEALEGKNEEHEPAWVLIIRGGVEKLLGDTGMTSETLTQQLLSLSWDSKAKMYGRVVDKHARHNLCFSEEAQQPDYEKGQGTVIAFDSIPILRNIREKLPEVLGQKANKLVAEGNLYYDSSVCGIGFHGDAERHIVVALRLGETIPLHYQWFKQHKPIGERVKLSIDSGDMYIMSAKAVGTDWKKPSIMTLRHAAGAEKFLTITK
jgi:hypothetical protein